ncbi:hypothetical protein J6590_000481 [Homalodisca vitripennis]|nr:hypothetical protein J6590_000481 [Homalodisca vitripennis]
MRASLIEASFVLSSPYHSSGPTPSTATLEETGSVNNQLPPIRQRNSRSIENVTAVRESVRGTRGSWHLACALCTLKLQLGEFCVCI